MSPGGHGAFQVSYVGADAERADWVRAGFERADADVAVAVETTVADVVTAVEDGLDQPGPRERSPLADTQPPLDCVVVSDDGEWDPIDAVGRIRDVDADVPVVLFVGDSTEALARDAIAADVTDYVTTDDENPTGVLAERVLDRARAYRHRRRERREGDLARRVVARSPDIVTVVRPGGVVAYQNETVAEVLGLDPDDVKNMAPYERVHEDDWRTLREAIYDGVIDGESAPAVEVRLADADGEWRTVEARARNLLDDPVVQGFVVTTRDVTDRRERERELERHRRILGGVGDPMYALDLDGTFTWVNDAFVERTGHERESVLDTHVSTVVRDQDVEAGADLIADLLRDEGREWGQFEFVGETGDGETCRYEDTVGLLTDEDGEIRGTVGVIREVPDTESS